VWTLLAERALAERDAFDEFFDRLLAIRSQIARNAGLASHREYAFRALCGVSRIPAARGAWFVGASILRDLAALNARELLPWDYWGLAREWGRGTVIPPMTAARLDEIAALIAGPALDLGAVRAAYETAEDFRVPRGACLCLW
jgi:hypothetical protein